MCDPPGKTVRQVKLMPRGNKLTVAHSTTGDEDFPVISLSVVSKFLGWFRGPIEKFTIFPSVYLKPTRPFEFVPVWEYVINELLARTLPPRLDDKLRELTLLAQQGRRDLI